jgi:hypothetical protein
MIIVVTGSRTIDRLSPEALYRLYQLSDLPDAPVLYHGGANGADKAWRDAAVAFDIPHLPFIPDWKPDGHFDREAGHVRNALMIETAVREDKNAVLFTLWDGESTGTANCMKEAAARGVPLEHFGAAPGTITDPDPVLF